MNNAPRVTNLSTNSCFGDQVSKWWPFVVTSEKVNPYSFEKNVLPEYSNMLITLGHLCRGVSYSVYKLTATMEDNERHSRNRIQDIHVSFGHGFIPVFPPPTRRSLWRYPYKVLQSKSLRRRRGLCYNGINSRLPSLPLLLSKYFKKRLEKVWTEVFPHVSHWLNTHLPNLLIPLPSPLTVTISICNQAPCFVYAVSSGPLWPTFYHYKW